MAGGERVLTGSLLDTIGETPLVELPRLSPKESVRLYAKLEGANPTGSIKDRVARTMVEAAEASGELEPGRELLEPTSGNTGISLALVAKVKGELYGARIVSSPASQGSNGAVRMALRMAESDPRHFMLNQYGNEANPRAHYEGTGAEIVDALSEVDALVAGLGTGGTLMGAGDRIREANPDAIVAAAEPLQGDLVYGLRSLADGYVPPILDVSKLDRKILVSNEDSVRGVRMLLEREGVFAGVSSGAVLHVARRLALELDEGTVVAVLADGGWKYLSADFWTAPIGEADAAMEDRLWW
ncbi:MAG: cysteine synthase family protein [Actinobacteria bacterium]|nr:MAG: cysteine synthase family protein [Actinomycetota bacterium]